MCCLRRLPYGEKLQTDVVPARSDSEKNHKKHSQLAKNRKKFMTFFQMDRNFNLTKLLAKTKFFSRKTFAWLRVGQLCKPVSLSVSSLPAKSHHKIVSSSDYLQRGNKKIGIKTRHHYRNNIYGQCVFSINK